MPTDNAFIAEQFSLLAKLMDIHGENSFKTRSYANAAFAIDRLPEELHAIPREKIAAIRGIGASIAKLVAELLDTGRLDALAAIRGQTPPGVLDMLRLKGVGPKKIATIWKDMEIESVGELLYACDENRLTRFKGFGEKTQNSIRETIHFYLQSQGNALFAEAEGFAEALHAQLQAAFPSAVVWHTGQFRLRSEIINRLSFVTTAAPAEWQAVLERSGYRLDKQEGDRYSFAGGALEIVLHHAAPARAACVLFATSASPEFLAAWTAVRPLPDTAASEEEIFLSANLHPIPAFLRETPAIIARAADPLPPCIAREDIRGIIHAHSTWSDGNDPLERMALAAREQGFEYLVISDHSKSAFYASGLSEERVLAQHEEIDALNARLAGFRVFKGIEADILPDGSLDYGDDVLKTFDVVIASVHSNLRMTEEKAMTRLLRAIENPYTRILGHCTGRLLLSRPGYPVDHRRLIDACAANGVALELNAHPRRLDVDWRWIGYALDKGVLISIDPDAHSIAGYGDLRYGVFAAQKGGLTAERNVSSFSLDAFTEFLALKKSL